MINNSKMTVCKSFVRGEVEMEGSDQFQSGRTYSKNILSNENKNIVNLGEDLSIINFY